MCYGHLIVFFQLTGISKSKASTMLYSISQMVIKGIWNTLKKWKLIPPAHTSKILSNVIVSKDINTSIVYFQTFSTNFTMSLKTEDI